MHGVGSGIRFRGEPTSSESKSPAASGGSILGDYEGFWDRIPIARTDNRKRKWEVTWKLGL